MALRIVYFRAGVEIGALPCPKQHSEAVKAAKAGLTRFGADAAQIVDLSDEKKKFNIVLRDA